MATDTNYLLEVRDLRQHFKIKGGKGAVLKAVDGVSFGIRPGETLGLVGESGCGKSTVARTIMRIYNPTAGQILVDGKDIGALSQREMKPYRKQMQMIFQDPMSSLNGRMTVRELLAEPLIAHGVGSAAQRGEMAEEILARVGLDRGHANRYPHEFSGGQRQRIGIARALILQPKIIICDEAISALDVSIQAQVVNMLTDFQQEQGFTYLFIAHDLSMVRYVSHQVGVMYLGRLVELCESEEIYRNPLHPYTGALMASVPIPDPKVEREKTVASIEGEVPSPINPPSGCHFHKRCPKAMPVCEQQCPAFRDQGGGHYVACHLYSKSTL